MRSLSKGDGMSDIKLASGSVINMQSHSNSAILRKSNKALKPGGGRTAHQVLSNRDSRIEAMQNEIQQEYSSLPENPLDNQNRSDAALS